TFVCRSTDDQFEPEWTYENGTIINPSMSSEQQITSYLLSETRSVYLRLAPVVAGTYICRSRPVDMQMAKEEVTITTTSITLIAES
ncbi:unnamed protein product, partial [Rotaria sordida]